MAKSLSTIIWAAKNSDSFKGAIIAQSFVITGEQHPREGEVGYKSPQYPVVGYDNISVNPERILRLNLTDVSDGEMRLMIGALPEGIKLFLESGTLTTPQMDALGIPRLENGYPIRHKLALPRQGAVLLTLEASIKRIHEEKEAKRPRTDEEKAVEIKRVADEKALVEAEKIMKINNDKEEKKRKKSDDIILEKNRRSNLSPVERKAEDAAIKADKKAKKDEKDIETQQRLLNAQILIQQAGRNI